MGFRFERRARSRKARTRPRSWLGKPPGAREVHERLRRLFPRVWKAIELLDVAPLHPVIERLSDGDRRGRAEAYDTDGVHVVHGLVASAPHVAILTCKGAERDQPWALATWRSLRLA